RSCSTRSKASTTCSRSTRTRSSTKRSDNMKLLVVGAGGREHALAWRLSRSSRVQCVYVAPGNGGTAREPGLENVPITDIDALADFAERERIAFTVVGPEAPLAAGIVDRFRARRLRIFG